MKHLRTIIIVAVIGYVIYSYFGGADRDDSGQIVSEGTLDAFSIRVGDCTNEPDSDPDEEGISSVLAVPCSQPHDNEFYYKFDVSHPEYPGDEPMYEEAFEGCYEQFELFVGLDYDSSVLEIYPLYPSEGSWAQDDREVICGLYHIDFEKLTGSVKGLAI